MLVKRRVLSARAFNRFKFMSLAFSLGVVVTFVTTILVEAAEPNMNRVAYKGPFTWNGE
jgi:hypothetical protein